MMRCYLSLSMVLMAALCIGCGSSGSASSQAKNSFRENIGAFPGTNIVRTTDTALQSRYGYRFTRRVETAEDIYFETEWKDVPTFDDERAKGVDFVRVRIFLSARPRNRSVGSLGSFTTTFEAEVLTRVNMTGEWTEMDMTTERRSYIREISDYLENELRTQFRG